MQREIKFRGRCIKSNDWVFGDLIHCVGHKNGNIYILPSRMNLAYVKHCDPLDGVQVVPETIGQFTGVTDINGVEVYEGDLLQVPRTDFSIEGVHEVWFFQSGYVTSSVLYSKKQEANKHDLFFKIQTGAYVIGNVFENPTDSTK